MSGFGIRSLKKQQDTSDHSQSNRYIKNVVIGENPYGYLTFNKIFNPEAEGEVAFVTQNIYLSEQIQKDLKCSMNAIRSNEVADELSFQEMAVKEATADVVFYKDTKFHKFGSRAKPHTLLEGESFFTSSFHPLNIDLEIDDDKLKKHQLHKIIRKIRVVEPTDLVEPTYFELHTGEEEIIRCERLYFCENPRDFYQLVENKEDLSESLKQYLVGVENHPGISVHFQCKGKFTDHIGSMIVPQSLTHDWGSFILDIEEFDGTYQNFKVLTFVNEDDLQDEDLAKKIRLMRKVLERVLPELTNCDYQTTIKYDPALRLQGINDDLSAELKKESVRFAGPGAAISHPKSELFQYFARGAVSISQL